MGTDFSGRIACVIPAAGRSSRMGRWKPMLPWRGATVVEAVIAASMRAGLAPFVVAGYRADELRSRLSEVAGVTVAYNAGWERGMIGSIHAGALAARDAFGEGFAGFVVAPADMPAIPPEAFAAVARAGAAQAKPQAVFAARGERLGHPVFIPAAYIQNVASAPPGDGLRRILLDLGWTTVEVDDDGIFADVDTLEEYENLLADRGGG